MTGRRVVSGNDLPIAHISKKIIFSVDKRNKFAPYPPVERRAAPDIEKRPERPGSGLARQRDAQWAAASCRGMGNRRPMTGKTIMPMPESMIAIATP